MTRLWFLGITYWVLPKKWKTWWTKRWTIAFLCGMAAFWTIAQFLLGNPAGDKYVMREAVFLIWDILLVNVYAVIQFVLRAIDRLRARREAV
jgi:hypothetical protein